MTPRLRTNDALTIQKNVSAKEFIRLFRKDKIVESVLILPKLGSAGFGKFRVTLKK